MAAPPDPAAQVNCTVVDAIVPAARLVTVPGAAGAPPHSESALNGVWTNVAPPSCDSTTTSVPLHVVAALRPDTGTDGCGK